MKKDKDGYYTPSCSTPTLGLTHRLTAADVVQFSTKLASQRGVKLAKKRERQPVVGCPDGSSPRAVNSSCGRFYVVIIIKLRRSGILTFGVFIALDQFNDAHRRRIAIAISRFQDPRIAARSILIALGQRRK